MGPLSSLSSHVFYFSEFPPIANEQERSDYKRIFDREHQEYKDLQAELDNINKDLSNVDRELDELQEGSPQYLVRTSVFIYYLLFTTVHRFISRTTLVTYTSGSVNSCQSALVQREDITTSNIATRTRVCAGHHLNCS